MIYICPTCNKEFYVEEDVTTHFLKCWKEQNPHHKSKPAPRSEDVTMTEIDENIMAFFTSFGEKK